MKNNKKVALSALTGLTAIVLMGWVAPMIVSVTYEAPKKVLLKINHEQETYIAALEWCESRGVVTAVNPNDLDNTPSYYSWQWKPSTFKYFGVKYKILPEQITDAEATKVMTDYAMQRRVIEQMVLHRDQIEWAKQFPGCTKKIGFPPVIHRQELTRNNKTHKIEL